MTDSRSHRAWSRRSLLAATASLPFIPSAVRRSPALSRRGRGRVAPVVVSSNNGARSVQRAWELMAEGASPTVAVVAGVKTQEDDPADMTVGLGGLPDESGTVTLDASVMDGDSHKAGAVACVRNIKNVASVALRVLDSTDHVLLVGEGAYEFARKMGFPHEELLTERAREAWLRWRRSQNSGDDWLDEDQRIPLAGATEGVQASRGVDPSIPVVLDGEEQPDFTWGTIHCSAVSPTGSVGSCTTTSGLSWKIPGRVGDSPIIGAGMYCDGTVGAAGATGRGESLIQSCGSYEMVRQMEAGAHPTDACLAALRRIARNTKRPDLLDERGRPSFNAVLYAVDKEGRHGSAIMKQRGGARYRAFTENGPENPLCAGLFED